MTPPSKKRKWSSTDDSESREEVLGRYVEHVAQLAAIERQIKSLKLKDEGDFDEFHYFVDLGKECRAMRAAKVEAASIFGRIFFENSKTFPVTVWQVTTTHHFSISFPEYEWCKSPLLQSKSRMRGAYFSFQDAMERVLHLRDSALKMGKVWDVGFPEPLPREADDYRVVDKQCAWALRQVRDTSEEKYIKLHSIVCFVAQVPVDAPGRMRESYCADDEWGDRSDSGDDIMFGLLDPSKDTRTPFMYDPVERKFSQSPRWPIENIERHCRPADMESENESSTEEGDSNEDDEAEDDDEADEQEDEVQEVEQDEDEDLGREGDIELGEDDDDSTDDDGYAQYA